MSKAWLYSPDLNLDDAVITLDGEGNVVALNEEADRLALYGDPHGKPLEVSFPIRDEFNGQVPVGLTRSVVLPSRGGELRAFDLLVLPHGRDRGWTIVLRSAISSGDVEHEAWANLSKESKEGTGVGDPTTGTLGLVSNTFAALHGYTPPEMLGMPLGRVFAKDGEGVFEMERRLQEGAVSWEADHLRKDGTVFPVLMAVTTIRDPLGLPRFRAMRIEDISERRESEHRLDAQRQLLERVIATVPSSVYLIDLIAGGVRYLSRDIAHTLGYPPEEGPIPNEIEKDPRFTLASVHPEDRSRMLAYWHQMESLKEGEVRSIEYRFRDARGLYRWFRSRETLFERDAEGRVARVLGVSHDVDEIKESERTEALRLELVDAFRSLDDPDEIQRIACHRLGQHLGANRVLCVEIVNQRDAIRAQAYLDGVPPLPETFTIADYGEGTVAILKSGGTHVVRDSEADSALSEPVRAAFAGIEVRASIGIGLIREDRWVAAFGVHQAVPRVWTDAEIVLVREVADRVWTAIERVRAEAAVRAAAARDAFRLAYADAIRPLTDPAEIGSVTAVLLGRYLGADRAAYTEYSNGGRIGAVLADHDQVGRPSVVGAYELARFDPRVLADLLGGRTAVIANVEEEPSLDEETRAAHRETGIGAYVTVPIHDGGLVASLAVHQATPRVWTVAEISLIEEIADRTRTAIERARAEMELRASEARYRALVDLGPPRT